MMLLGFSALLAGLVISLQVFFATLAEAARMPGVTPTSLGPKKIVVFGLCWLVSSGLSYLLAGLEQPVWPLISLLLLCLGGRSSWDRAEFRRHRA